MNLNQITVPSLNLSKSVHFYQQLGLRLIVHSTDYYARFESPNGTSTFSIHQVTELPSGDGIWVYFESEKLDDLVAELISNDIEFEELPTDKPWLWREARLKDPDGNQLILYYAGNNRLTPPWRIDQGQGGMLDTRRQILDEGQKMKDKRRRIFLKAEVQSYVLNLMSLILEKTLDARFQTQDKR